MLKKYVHGKFVEEVRSAPEREQKERSDFNLDGWRLQFADRFQVNDEGETVLIGWPDSMVREHGGKLLREHELLNAKKRHVELSGNQQLLRACPECEGRGYTGEFTDSNAETCPACAGFGVEVSPLLIEIISALAWVERPVKKITAAEIFKQNKVNELKREADKKRKEIEAEHAAKVSEARNKRLQEIQAKSAEQLAKERAKVDAELAEKLAALEKA